MLLVQAGDSLTGIVTSRNHCLSSLSATRVTTLWLNNQLVFAVNSLACKCLVVKMSRIMVVSFLHKTIWASFLSSCLMQFVCDPQVNRYVHVPNLAHFGNHFLPILAYTGMPILELIQNWQKQHPCSVGRLMSHFYQLWHISD